MLVNYTRDEECRIAIIDNGKLDITKVLPIARLGYAEYARVETTFTMRLAPRPPAGTAGR